jgi:predicted MPP superfamily phosphohydrolase
VAPRILPSTVGGRALLATAGAGLAVATGAHIWAHQVETHRYTLREHTLRILPAGTRPVRVLHISDIHLMPDDERKLAFLRFLASTKPHLVIDTGDNIASALAIPRLAQAIGPLLQVPGAFVMGSNDMYAPTRRNPLRYFKRDPRPEGMLDESQEETLPTQALRDVLGAHGWLDLTNTRGRLALTGLDVELVGVDDPHLERDRFPEPAVATGDETVLGDETALAGGTGAVGTGADGAAGAEPNPTLRIGVAHAPYRRVLDAFVADGAELILAGHTHGGQLRVPGIGALVTNCDLPRSQAKGLSTWRGVPLHVSGGMGANPYSNYRFANPPEATLLTLRAPRA